MKGNIKRKIIVNFTIVIVCLVASQSLAIEFIGGTGDPNDPYQIATAEQLRAIGDSNIYDKSFILIADIDMDPNLPGNEIVVDSSFIDSFKGILDGNGYSISNMVMESYYTGRGGNLPLGLIGYLYKDGIVKNIELRNISIRGVGH